MRNWMAFGLVAVVLMSGCDGCDPLKPSDDDDSTPDTTEDGGNISVVDGGLGDASVSLPDGGSQDAASSDGAVQVPDGGAADGAVVQQDGGTADGAVVDGGVADRDASSAQDATVPQDAAVQEKDGSMTDGATSEPDAAVTDAATSEPDASVADAATSEPDASVADAGGGQSDGSVIMGDGGTADAATPPADGGSGDAGPPAVGAEWVKTSDTLASTQRFSPRRGHTVTAHNGALWLVGGSNGNQTAPTYLKDVWRSEDGVNWQLVTANPVSLTPPAEFLARDNHAAASFDGKLWVMAGRSPSNGTTGDAWYTTDGINWTRHAFSISPALGRHSLAAVVYNGRLWAMGGEQPSNGEMGEVVYTEQDGAGGYKPWVRVRLTDDPNGFGARAAMGAAVFTDTDGVSKMWLVGGRVKGFVDYSGDVFVSTDGITWTQKTGVTGLVQNQIADHVLSVSQGALWITGGAYYQLNPNGQHLSDRIYRSTDGVTWSDVTPSPVPYVARKDHAADVLDTRLFVVGGTKALNGEPSSLLNDVYSTADGTTWSTTRTMSPRAWHCSLTFDDGTGERMFAVGGYSSSGYFSDVWASADGVDFQLVNSNAPFGPRAHAGCAVFNNEIVVTGGESAWNAPYKDVWSSPDGVNWTQLTDNAAFAAGSGRTNHTLSVLDLGSGPELVLVGGAVFNGVGSDYQNDVYASADGMTWRPLTAAAPFMPRADHVAFVLGDRLYIGGGKVSGGTSNWELWSTTDGVNWQTEGHLPIARWGQAAAVDQQHGLVMVTGGRTSNNGPFTHVWVWAGPSTSWIDVPPIPGGAYTDRAGHGLVVLDNAFWILMGDGGATVGQRGDVWRSAINLP